MPISKVCSNIFKSCSGLFHACRDWLFPPRCCVCGKISQNEPFLCLSCYKKLNIYGREPDSVVYHKDHPADLAVSLYYFDPVFQELAHSLKYKGMWYLGQFLGREMGKYFSDMAENCDAVVPIPLHSMRRRDRGYNQSVMIGKGIASVWHVPLESRLLKRNRYTETQTKLNKKERQKNMDGVFTVRSNYIIPKRICLVDDVFTTGATTMEAARTLKKAGAQHVIILTAATPRRDQKI